MKDQALTTAFRVQLLAQARERLCEAKGDYVGGPMVDCLYAAIEATDAAIKYALDNDRESHKPWPKVD